MDRTKLIISGVFLCTLIFGLFFTNRAQGLPTQTSTLFSGSGNCALCHQPGPPNPAALLAPNGSDISPVTLWRSTMMGNAAKDPFWQAKVTAEVSAHPQFQQIIEDKCTTCHSPMGRTEAIYHGQQYYSLTQMQSDPLARDGVSCTVCHQINENNLGTGASFSGHYLIENEHLIYGPYHNPFANPMIMMSGYTPVFGEHMEKSELCATCHTLFTPTVDNSGQIVGEAPEQTPYLEWKNSQFPGQDVQCQTCHMPAINDPVVISNRPFSLAGRSPFAKHYFVGGNVFMLRLLKDHATEIGVTATATQMDSTIARTLRLLRQETVELSANYFWKQPDTLVVKIAVKNLSGHKFPTAYPSRRAWLFFELKDANGQSLFISGNWNTQDGEIIGLDSLYEPHYDVIRHSDQVQVYQSIMKDVDENVNYTLLRAAGYLKDNRIPPAGFTSNGLHYDSIAVVGLASQDPNFNRSGNNEGTGTDTVSYKIGGLMSAANYLVSVRMVYQTLAPRFVADLAQYNTPEVQTFLNYYNQADNTPITLDSLQITVSSTGFDQIPLNAPAEPVVKTFPNPFNPEVTIQVQIARAGEVTAHIYNLLGEKVHTLVSGYLTAGNHNFLWNAANVGGKPVASGTYLVEVTFRPRNSSHVYRQHQKIVYLK